MKSKNFLIVLEIEINSTNSSQLQTVCWYKSWFLFAFCFFWCIDIVQSAREKHVVNFAQNFRIRPVNVIIIFFSRAKED